jgi:Na+-translocating ferredoxin:NAD+ oxidoreductase subunit G
MSTVREPTAPEMAVRTAAILFIFVILFTGFLAAAYHWTRPAILASAKEEKMALFGDVLPSERYNNALLKDTIELPASRELGTSDPMTVYRARKDGAPVAILIEAVAPDGYSGRIRLLLAVGHDGKLSGVRVLSHKETPGLGDYIEPRKDRNKKRPWITQFEGRSLGSPPPSRWKVKKDGGDFDANTGATVTPRAIVKAVLKALQFVESNRDRLFAVSGDKP